MAKKPVSSKLREKKRMRNSIIAFCVILVALSVGLYLLSNRAPAVDDLSAEPVLYDEDGQQLYHIHTLVTGIDEENITAQVIEPDQTGLIVGDTVQIPMELLADEGTGIDLETGHILTVWFNGKYELNMDQAIKLDGIMYMQDDGVYEGDPIEYVDANNIHGGTEEIEIEDDAPEDLEIEYVAGETPEDVDTSEETND